MRASHAAMAMAMTDHINNLCQATEEEVSDQLRKVGLGFLEMSKPLLEVNEPEDLCCS
jgi:hypothetical protein